MKPITETKRQEQLDIVLRLNELTKQGKLTWEREPINGAYPRGSREAYVTQWKGYSIRVEKKQQSAIRGAGVLGRAFASGSYQIRVQEMEIRVQEMDNDPPESQDAAEDVVVIPPMPAIDDLVVTIKRTRNEPDRVENKEEHLQALRKSLGLKT